MERTALSLIDKLISCWNDWETHEAYYLKVLAPSIISSKNGAGLMENEKEIVTNLRRLLTQEEWLQLPSLIAQRRKNELQELASDRKRAIAQRKAKEQEERERAKRKEEEERKQREKEDKLKRLELSRRRAKENKKALIARVNNIFETDFLSADRLFSNDPDAELISGDEYRELKIRFVLNWADRVLDQKQCLDPEQAAAIADNERDSQVVARAGSGKTRTLITRALFLQKHCKVSPRAILLLAFNKKAAEEMKDRLVRVLGDDIPHVMTFHALAHAIVHPHEKILFDDTSADQFQLSYEVQEVIDEHIRSEEYGSRIRDLMLAHFREDWERIVNGRFQLSMDEFLAHRRSLPRESLNGDFVKSFGEKVTANALFEHGVEYKYERNFRWNGVNYRPDFTILDGANGGVIIEYFGLQGDPDYDEMSNEKRMFWAARDEWKFLEFSPLELAQKGEDGFISGLLDDLQAAGVPCMRRSEEEIWELVKMRAMDRFTGAMKTFVGRCRKKNLSPDNLEVMIEAHSPCSNAEELFLGVAASVYGSYLQRLASRSKEDFDGLIWRAVSKVRDGQTRFVRNKGKEKGNIINLRYVMIDEFQDFSAMFNEFIAAIRSINPGAQFFCVGDDWQAINGFAGSDLQYFTYFSRYFHNHSQCYIRTNYRSSKSVVEVGNALMQGRGPTAQPSRSENGRVWLCKLNEFRPTASEQMRHNGDEITPAILRLVKCFLDEGQKVVILSRRHGLPWYVGYQKEMGKKTEPLMRFREHLRSFLPEDNHHRIKVSTAHGYKGLEESAIIIIDAVKGSYPLIHPNWVFLRLFGDTIGSIDDEERRLFYVAITRAKESLAIVTEKGSESPYLDDVRREVRINSLKWGALSPIPSLDGARIEIRVSNAFKVKDQLKDLGYRWNSGGKYWSRPELEEGFSLETLVKQSWNTGLVRIEVYSETGELLHRF